MEDKSTTKEKNETVNLSEAALNRAATSPLAQFTGINPYIIEVTSITENSNVAA